MDPEQIASLEASISGSTVFPKRINTGSAGQGLRAILCETSPYVRPMYAQISPRICAV